MQPLNRLIAANGTYTLDSSTTGTFIAAIPHADTVVDVLKEAPIDNTSNETDVLVAQNKSGKTLGQGVIFTPSKGNVFTTISVSSGSLELYKR